MTTDALFDTQTPAADVATVAAVAGHEPGRTVGREESMARPASGMLAEDREWASAMYSLFARGGDDEQQYLTVVPGDPWSKSRPRFARSTGRSYQPRDDREAEARLQGHLSVRAQPFLGNVMVACRFYRANMQRVDTDNLLKHVCDSATGVLWADDSQVTLILGELHLDRDYPRTVILVGNHTSTMTRGDDDLSVCEHCGGPFRRNHNTPTKKTCSRLCANAIRGMPDLSLAIPCPHCGVDFRRKTSKQKYCSADCARASKRGVPKGRTRVTRCPQCGAVMSHNRGGRCRDCWRQSPSGQPTPVQGEIASGDSA